MLSIPPPLPRFLLTKTTRTAAEAAQAPKTSGHLAFVTRPTQTAKAVIYPAVRPSLFYSSVTYYKFHMAPKRTAAMTALRMATTIAAYVQMIYQRAVSPSRLGCISFLAIESMIATSLVLKVRCSNIQLTTKKTGKQYRRKLVSRSSSNFKRENRIGYCA